MATKDKVSVVEPNNNEAMIVNISETMRMTIWNGPVGWLYEMWLHKIFVVSCAVAAMQMLRLINHTINGMKLIKIAILPP